MRAPTNDNDTGRCGRRENDRRKADAPFDGVDRRKGDRRSGHDRRSNPRVTTE